MHGPTLATTCTRRSRASERCPTSRLRPAPETDELHARAILASSAVVDLAALLSSHVSGHQRMVERSLSADPPPGDEWRELYLCRQGGPARRDLPHGASLQRDDRSPLVHAACAASQHSHPSPRVGRVPHGPEPPVPAIRIANTHPDVQVPSCLMENRRVFDRVSIEIDLLSDRQMDYALRVCNDVESAYGRAS